MAFLLQYYRLMSVSRMRRVYIASMVIVSLWSASQILVHIVLDLAIIVMPLPIVWRLQLPLGQKLLLSGIFGLGFFTIAISIFRLQWLTPQKDFTWWNVTAASWSLAELVSGIACACLPTYKPLLTKLKQCTGRGDKSVRLQSRSVEFSDDSKVEMPSIYTGTYGTQTSITATNVYTGGDGRRKSRKDSKSTTGKGGDC
ncbi:integral membrane protein [Fusarium flagelliforme]|uniref:Integral membrane protein n=1 Tax=Fusarium flagelliforme TaxID=2675880 RepID=A0A395M9C1_9HYPO|nr:integral membrane protein [Fusarium flagelliforme]